MFLPPFQTAALPDPTVPVGVTAVATTHGSGVQIYTCKQAAGEKTGWQWVFEAPEATLTDAKTHQEVARHSKGPTWVWRDGSRVTGKVIMQSLPPRGSIAELLLQTAHAAGTPAGFLTPVSFIRRSSPSGGAAPAEGCDAAHAAKVIRVPYTAVYTFYRSN